MLFATRSSIVVADASLAQRTTPGTGTNDTAVSGVERVSNTTIGLERTYLAWKSRSMKVSADAAVRFTVNAITAVDDLLGLVDNSMFFSKQSTPM